MPTISNFEVWYNNQPLIVNIESEETAIIAAISIGGKVKNPDSIRRISDRLVETIAAYNGW